MKRIGILGGSYNPPHIGHRLMADEAKMHLGLDELWMWVSYNIFKDLANYAPLEHRVAMTRMLATGRPWMKVTDMEKDFCGSTTANSLTLLKTMFPKAQFIWIFGDDNFASFHTWNRQNFKIDGQPVPDWQYILNNFPLAVMHRPGYRKLAKASEAARYGTDMFVKDPRDLGKDMRGWSFVRNIYSRESSTHTKQDLLKGKRGIKGLQQEVEDYIYHHGLLSTRQDFNAAAIAQQAPAQDVRFQSFLLLASTTNLIKAVFPLAASHMADMASTAWDKSFEKGIFKKSSYISEGLVQCLTPVLSLASHQGGGTGHSPQAIIESLVNLCVAEGFEKDKMLNLMQVILNDPDSDDPSVACQKTLDILKSYEVAPSSNFLTVTGQTIKPDAFPIPRP